MAKEIVTIQTGESEDGAPFGWIRWEIDKISELTDEGRDSPEIDVQGIPWKVNILIEDEDGVDMVWAYLATADNDSVMWSIDVSLSFTLFNKIEGNEKIEEFSNKFDHDCNGCGCNFNKCTWEELINEEKGFVTDDRITIEVKFKLSNIMGIRRPPRFDFTNASNPRHDITMIFGGKKLYASKQILSANSPVFDAMFYGNFEESNKKDIELKDVEYEDFLEMLNVIYPSGKKITENNAVNLLSIGDRFQIKTLTDHVEQFLITSKTFSVAAKLKLSGDYRLVMLQGKCLDKLKKIADVTDLQDTADFKGFSDATKLSLFEKILKLAKT